MKIQAADTQIKAKEKSKERYEPQVKPLKGTGLGGGRNGFVKFAKIILTFPGINYY